MKEADSAGWYTYMVRCQDNTFYTGITTDLARRVTEHNQTTKGARYTATRRPVVLVYHELHPNRSTAAGREYRIRRLPVAAKEKLLQDMHQEEAISS